MLMWVLNLDFAGSGVVVVNYVPPDDRLAVYPWQSRRGVVGLGIRTVDFPEDWRIESVEERRMKCL